ncbi:unnamed protein product [Symbiodinium natans]|uniref:EF-hand domain-containing protein n=1 Tax=Symbiodinium natans TaxID=878477 RepID=A0A812PYA4_9DINO|nr:unnamed protein product [Symbiodinium natans]
MGQEITKIGEECNCFVGSEPDREPTAQVYRAVDPVANLVTKEFPKSVLSPSPAPKWQVYNVNPWVSAEEEEGFFVPPPPPPQDPEPAHQAEEPSAEQAPHLSSPAKATPVHSAQATQAAQASRAPVPEKPAAKPKAAAPTAESGRPKPRAEGAGAAGKSSAITFEAMQLDLEGAEEAAFTAAFKSLSSGQAVLQPDHDQLRNFILVNSGVSEQDLDTELLKIASGREDFCVDVQGFITLLREHPVSEEDTLMLFMNISNDGESMTSEDCRTCLVQLAAKLPDANIREDRMEQIFDTVMTSAGLSVSMEQWMAFAKTAARIIRLMAYTKAR